VIDLPLAQTQILRRAACLTYTSAPGEVVALLSSTDQYDWKIVQTQTAWGKTVAFNVKPAPSPNGPFYRAIIFDRAGIAPRAGK
jgi:hypothetical protein